MARFVPQPDDRLGRVVLIAQSAEARSAQQEVAAARRVETRIPGGDANPYLAFAAVIAAGLHGIDPMTWTEDYQAAVLEVNHRVFDRVGAVVGEQVWNFADFATGPGVFRVDGNRKGVFTRDRRPKAAAHLLRRRWRGSRRRAG